MYTADRVHNSFHVYDRGSNTGKGKMRASTKVKMINLIMSNFAARMDVLEKGFVTITYSNGAVYGEFKVYPAVGAYLLFDHKSFVDNDL